MRTALFASLSFCVTAAALAQQNAPGSVTPAATQTTPIRVEVAAADVAAIEGVTSSQDGGPGVSGRGYFVGVSGHAGVGVGGEFSSAIGGGVSAHGMAGGVEAGCGGSSCTAIRAIAGSSRAGTGLFTSGAIGLISVGDQSGLPEDVRAVAGIFRGHVDVTGDVTIAGRLNATVIDQLLAQIAFLSARVAALEGHAPKTGAPVPARIQAEDYDEGGQGKGYSDLTTGNIGGVYRNDDVDIKESQEGGYAVGWMTSGEWLAYTISAQSAGTYTLHARVGSGAPGRTLVVSIDGVPFSTITVPGLVGWDVYSTVTIPQVSLAAGQHVIRFTVGAADYVDFNWFEIISTKPLSVY